MNKILKVNGLLYRDGVKYSLLLRLSFLVNLNLKSKSEADLIILSVKQILMTYILAFQTLKRN